MLCFSKLFNLFLINLGSIDVNVCYRNNEVLKVITSQMKIWEITDVLDERRVTAPLTYFQSIF